MRFKAPPVEIPDANPFVNDSLQRKDSAEILTQFLTCLNEPFVLAIDSPWGSGKTIFLKMWRKMLLKSGFRCLYFSAWENDFSDSPLISIIGEIGVSLKDLAGSEEAASLSLGYKNIKKWGAAVAKTAAPAIVKIATAGIVDVEGIGDELGKLAEDMVKKKIEEYEADKNTIHEFRKSLSEFINQRPQGEVDASRKPVVFIIDELDRCRPNYAIELLEKMKHLFSVDGLVFVLAIDKVQLGHSIRSIYGDGLNSEGYLRRFIDLEYRLPKASPKLFVRAQFERFGLDSIFSKRHSALANDGSDLEETIVEFFSLFDFSLRVQEQCCTQITIVLRMTPPNHYLLAPLLGTLICLRVQNNELYIRYVEGLAAPEEVLKYIRQFPKGEKMLDSMLGAIIEAHLVTGIRSRDARNRAVNQYDKIAQSEGPGSELVSRSKVVADHLRPLSRILTIDVTDYLFKKIEIAHRFVNLEEPVN